MGKKKYIYVANRTKVRVKTAATKERRTQADFIDFLMDMYDNTTAVEQAHIVSGERWRPDAKEAR